MVAVGLQYIAFLSMLGQASDLKACLEKYRSLFADILMHTINGTPGSISSDAFISKKHEVLKSSLSATVTQKHISCDEQGRTMTLCYTIAAKNRPTIITTVILTLNQDDKITNIFEVSAPAQEGSSSQIIDKIADLDLSYSTKDEQEELDCKLGDFNFRQVPPTQAEIEVDLSLCLKKEGRIVAGINACMYAWYITYVHILYVDEGYRGQDLASQLLKRVEETAKAKGSKLIHLDTFSFQARDFYLKQGYEIFGTLDDCPKGHKRYYLKKVL